MKTRLNACDRWHLGEPSELAVYARKDRRGCAYDQVWCLTCGRARCKSYRKQQNTTKGYGVLPRLTWTAPEFMT